MWLEVAISVVASQVFITMRSMSPYVAGNEAALAASPSAGGHRALPSRLLKLSRRQ